MIELIANKQSSEQKKSNDFARYNFILAMMNMDLLVHLKEIKQKKKKLSSKPML
mgnify:CR=1 FL=1